MVTIRDVAKLANVSVATVSRVLNAHPSISDKTRQAVLAAVEELGYYPNANAQALATQSSDTIGVVVTDVTDSFFAILVKAVDQVASAHQRNILIGIGYHNPEKEKQAIDLLLKKRCNALVVHSKALSDEILSEYLQRHPGMVIINRTILGFEQRCIALDNEKGTYLATNTLINHGHKYIGYIGSNHQINDEIERKSGYLKALSDHDLPIMPHAIANSSPDYQGGEETMIKLLSYNSNLTAVVCYNDSMAAGALSILNENNIKVPQQFSLIGFDDMPLANYLVPKLTTIRYPIDLMATYAAELALSLVNKALASPENVTFNPTLVKRFSVKAI
ncbi:LacI family DNA-binding transcriptional regulator [Pasteurellaceae bacterium USgator11]|nr:LacI family DNA-binding transcriptional regulator [Pasteurellaceae bacterium UScroc12]TNG97456.1 LacI family DNA-binding transcriptional regulator [Pasteurellaceae bacterium UScroc31]TNG98367.1 LacI family DNA-binding transcriptional regulator [Pasteurellaceae bacterium USgator41]TNH02775.1 LacI family DNA-binding transcriptional regulator [Pasteurellaceae bacterium USgator11]